MSLLHQTLNIQFKPDSDDLPNAHTCFNTMIYQHIKHMKNLKVKWTNQYHQLCMILVFKMEVNIDI